MELPFALLEPQGDTSLDRHPEALEGRRMNSIKEIAWYHSLITIKNCKNEIVFSGEVCYPPRKWCALPFALRKPQDDGLG